VEANPARVYRKLDIHSRAELGARLGTEAQSPASYLNEMSSRTR
jgi:hypothetical protein